MDVLVAVSWGERQDARRRDSGGGQHEDVLWTVDAGQGHGRLAEDDARESSCWAFPAAFDDDGRGQLLIAGGGECFAGRSSVRSKSRTWADGAKLWLVKGRVKKKGCGCGGAALPANP